MDLVVGNKPVTDLSKIPYVKDVFCGYNGSQITIHLRCDEGDEQYLFDSLPKWIHDEIKVVKGDRHVFLKPKK